MKQRILSNGQNYRLRLPLTKLTMKQDVFPGLGIETENGHLLVYTGVMEKEADKEKVNISESVSCAGRWEKYTKLEQNPVITGEMLPEHFSREHFRDPKIGKKTMDTIW